MNGRFSPEQRELYQIVRDAQEAFVRQIKPGVAYKVADDSGAAVVAKGLVRLGLIQAADATIDPPHGVQCPASGLPAEQALRAARLRRPRDRPRGARPRAVLHGRARVRRGRRVHGGARDSTSAPSCSGSLPDTPKNRAMMTKIRRAVEKYKGMGVRIEDDYALTDSGLEWLSSGVPREINEIEALMQQPEPELSGGGTCGRPKT